MEQSCPFPQARFPGVCYRPLLSVSPHRGVGVDLVDGLADAFPERDVGEDIDDAAAVGEGRYLEDREVLLSRRCGRYAQSVVDEVSPFCYYLGG